MSNSRETMKPPVDRGGRLYDGTSPDVERAARALLRACEAHPCPELAAAMADLRQALSEVRS